MEKRFRGLWLRRPGSHFRRNGWDRPWLPLLLGLFLAFFLIRWFDTALRPQLIAISEAEVQNQLTQIADRAVARTLADQELVYGDMVTLQTEEGLSALTTDTAGLNRLRVSVLEDIITQLESLDSDSLGVPLGALTGIDLFSALGPALPVRVISVASAEGTYRNDFTSAGINQTLHRVMLDVALNARLLLPGGIVEVSVSTPICVAETVIIGQVPQTYLNWSP